MKLHYIGKYDGNENSLPKRKHPSNAIPFKEPGMRELAIIANVGCIITIVILAIPFVLISKDFLLSNKLSLILASLSACFIIPIHELLHAICFKEDVYYYTNLKQGLVFIIGTEGMSKSRFILMSLLPNIVLGAIPYIIFLLFPSNVFLGLFGLLCIGSGFGDYINVFNALTQMPKGSKTYLNGFHSYWYIEN